LFCQLPKQAWQNAAVAAVFDLLRPIDADGGDGAHGGLLRTAAQRGGNAGDVRSFLAGQPEALRALPRFELQRQQTHAEQVGAVDAFEALGDRGVVWQESYRLNAGRLMSKEFVERRDGSFYLIGSRVPLAHIVREFQRGASPEALRSHYPALSLEQVYGAITFYLGRQEDVEGDVAEREREEDAFTAAHPAPPEVRMVFERMRQQTVSRRG
jgi:uncharacterized protein (DUF433 family)